MMRVQRKYVVTQIENSLRDAIIDGDDETLAKAYEALLEQPCIPRQGMDGEFLLDDDGSN